MKVGVIPVNIGVQSADQVVQTAQFVESLGYESVWTFEHVVVPVNYESKYPYNKSGNMGAAPETTLSTPLSRWPRWQRLPQLCVWRPG